VPRPVRRAVECSQPIQSATPRALDFMAKHGINGLQRGVTTEGGAMHRVVLAWQEAHARIGQQLELGECLCFGRPLLPRPWSRAGHSRGRQILRREP